MLMPVSHGTPSAGAASCVPLDDQPISLSSREYDLAPTLEFDPEACMAPGSLPVRGLAGPIYFVPVSHFSWSTWHRLALGILGTANGMMCGLVPVSWTNAVAAFELERRVTAWLRVRPHRL
jgi:hypothetical protein